VPSVELPALYRRERCGPGGGQRGATSTESAAAGHCSPGTAAASRGTRRCRAPEWTTVVIAGSGLGGLFTALRERGYTSFGPTPRDSADPAGRNGESRQQVVTVHGAAAGGLAGGSRQSVGPSTPGTTHPTTTGGSPAPSPSQASASPRAVGPATSLLRPSGGRFEVTAAVPVTGRARRSRPTTRATGEPASRFRCPYPPRSGRAADLSAHARCVPSVNRPTVLPSGSWNRANDMESLIRVGGTIGVAPRPATVSRAACRSSTSM
jgi:hypothetical protein